MDAKKADGLSGDFSRYFKDNLQQQLFREQSEDFLSPSTNLLKKKQQLNDIHQAMLAAKDDFNTTVTKQRMQQEELRSKEREMKESLLKFDPFLKENEMKCVRAVKKANHERELARQKAAELRALENDLHGLTQEMDRLGSLAEKNQIYPDYLLSVVRQCKQFDEPHQVVSRFDTLLQTREDLAKSSKEGEASVNRALAQLSHYIEQGEDKIIYFNNKLALLQTELDTVTSQAILWESRWVHIQNTAAKKTLMLGTIKMAALSLFVSLCGKDKEHKGVSQEDTLKQLSEIQSILLNLRGIIEGAHKTDHK